MTIGGGDWSHLNHEIFCLYLIVRIKQGFVFICFLLAFGNEFFVGHVCVCVCVRACACVRVLLYAWAFMCRWTNMEQYPYGGQRIASLGCPHLNLTYNRISLLHCWLRQAMLLTCFCKLSWLSWSCWGRTKIVCNISSSTGSHWQFIHSQFMTLERVLNWKLVYSDWIAENSHRSI